MDPNYFETINEEPYVEEQPTAKKPKKAKAAPTAFDVSDLIDCIKELGYEHLQIDKTVSHGQVFPSFLALCCFFYL